MNNLPAEGIPVHAEKLSGPGLVSTGFGKSALNEFSFEFIHRFAEVNTVFDHFGHERFQLIFHDVSFGNGFLILLLLPPALERAVPYEEFGLQLVRR